VGGAGRLPVIGGADVEGGARSEMLRQTSPLTTAAAAAAAAAAATTTAAAGSGAHYYDPATSSLIHVARTCLK